MAAGRPHGALHSDVLDALGGRLVSGALASGEVLTLASIARTGREALDDVRRLLLVMREDERRLGPQPGLADLPALLLPVEVQRGLRIRR